MQVTAQDAAEMPTSFHVHAFVDVHLQGLESKPVVPTHAVSLPPLAATTPSHVASAPVLPVHVPRDSPVQAALLAGSFWSEQAVLADADEHVLASRPPNERHAE